MYLPLDICCVVNCKKGTPFRRQPPVMPLPTWRVRTLLEDTAVFVEWDTREHLQPHPALKVDSIENIWLNKSKSLKTEYNSLFTSSTNVRYFKYRNSFIMK